MTEQKFDINLCINKVAGFYQSEEYNALKAMEGQDSQLDIFGKSLKEDVHTSMISWLFGNHEWNNLPEHPVIFLLRLFAHKADYQKRTNGSDIRGRFIDDKLWMSIITNDVEKLSIVTSDMEFTLPNKRRVDIIIECDILISSTKEEKKLRIVIENKITSKEHDEQCKEYYNYFAKKADGFINLFIYLSPYPVEELSDDHFVKISYQDLLDSVLNPLALYREKYSESLFFYLREYIKSITSINKNQLAMSKEQKELLKRLFNNNRELIIAAINASDESELKEKVQEAIKHKYTVTIKGNSRDGLSAADTAKIVANELSQRFNANQLLQNFKDLQQKCSSKTLEFNLKKTERYFIMEMNGVKRTFDDPYTCKDNQQVRCNNQWTFDKIKSLWQKLKDQKINDISIEWN